MKRDFLQNSIFYVLTLLIAFGLKYHYSRASSEDLIWILGPTARVVEHISGIPFEKESGTGYINPDYRIIIAASCAGVNFLIAAFCMAMYSCIHQIECHRLKFLWLVISFMSAYLVTLAANALRIIFAIVFYQTELTFIWFTSEQIHRLEGILVYFSFLCSYYWLLQGLMCRYVYRSGKEHQKKFRKHVSLYIPVFWYILIVLFVPLLNPAHHGDIHKFIEHSAFVL